MGGGNMAEWWSIEVFSGDKLPASGWRYAYEDELTEAAMNGHEHFLCDVVDRAVVDAQPTNGAPHESERFLINLVECRAHHRRTGIRQGEMSNLISRGKWDSEGQTAAFSKAAALEPTG